MRLTFAFAVAAMLALGGCAPFFFGPYYKPLGSAPPAITAPRPLPDVVGNAVEQMMTSAGPIDPHSTILVSTIQDLSRPPVFAESNLGLGKIVPEQVADRLIKLGYTVPEIRLRRSMLFNDNGQFMLSNNARYVRPVQNANFVVVGTYMPRGNVEYVNLKLVRLADGVPISATQFATPWLIHEY
jgi:hypothetical protein